MDIVIRSRNLELDDELRAVVHDKVSRLNRFLDGMEHADVVFFEERNPRIARSEYCEVTLAGHGHHVRAKASAAEALAAVDLVVDKLEHQLTKLKGRLVERSQPRRRAAKAAAVTNGTTTAPAQVSNGSAQPSAEPDDENVARIVKTKQFALKSMSPDEAALQLDLLQHDFYIFTNNLTARSAVIYRRDDGHLGLIDVE